MSHATGPASGGVDVAGSQTTSGALLTGGTSYSWPGAYDSFRSGDAGRRADACVVAVGRAGDDATPLGTVLGSRRSHRPFAGLHTVPGRHSAKQPPSARLTAAPVTPAPTAAAA
jgi:hypothetical protein